MQLFCTALSVYVVSVGERDERTDGEEDRQIDRHIQTDR